MTIRQVVQELRRRGYQVAYYERKDGGILIREINGVKYPSGSSGNKVAQNILGVETSKARKEQLTRITEERTTRHAKEKAKQIKAGIKKPKIKPLIKPSHDIQLLLNKAQKEWRKNPPKGQSNARVLVKNIRQMMEMGLDDKDIEGALKRSIQYAKGIIYSETVEAFILQMKGQLSMLKLDEQQFGYLIPLLEECIVETEKIKTEMKKTKFDDVTDKFYEFQKVYKTLPLEARAYLGEMLALIKE